MNSADYSPVYSIDLSLSYAKDKPYTPTTKIVEVFDLSFA